MRCCQVIAENMLVDRHVLSFNMSCACWFLSARNWQDL